MTLDMNDPGICDECDCMIGVRVIFQSFIKNVAKAIEKSSFKNLGHAAASLRKDVISTLLPSKHPSLPGTPPHTRTQQLPRSIVYDVDKAKQSAVVGPRYSYVGESGATHEFGLFYKGRKLPERQFMNPALERAIPRFAGEFAGSIGG